MYRASQILYAATDGCSSQPWLTSQPPASGSAYWCCSQTLTLLFQLFLSPISSIVSSVRTWRRLTFLFFIEPVSLNLLACLLIVLGLCTGHPGNFTRNLHHVSEHNFLLFIYVLWIYTCSHNENSCLGMPQIAIITITTLTALISNNNHNQ